jgi:sulfatase maturation enzyme AslB (radical SAM superfamily)
MSQSDNSRGENFCFAPFTNIVQSQSSIAGPCPYQSGCWHLKEVPIAERWTTPAVVATREAFLRNEQPPECARCFKEEAANFRSHRMHENENARYDYQEILDGRYLAGPKVMVLRPSNICNFACRTCHSTDTSLFKKEGQYYAETYGDVDSRYVETEARRQFSIDEMDEFFKLSGNLEELHFYGGEPMLNKTHHRIFEKLIASRDTRGINIFYCTNGSIYPDEERIALWSHFKNVHLHFSIDGVGRAFEYLRWPGKWSAVSENLRKTQDELPRVCRSTVSMGFNVTVSSMNIFDLPETFDYLTKFSNVIGVTTVHDPSYFSIRHIPETVKPVVAQRLRNSTHSELFKGLIEYMLSGKQDESEWKKFASWTTKMDLYRKQNFKEAFPEFSDLISPHLPSRPIIKNDQPVG